ncbi:alpha/beta fold hydrolase [Lichenicoccus roseus]|uniref:Alpha/beta hydrolase n=1 Tax=Lichenicoccus roseus TaxID=2683649 RepID=A0A5R9J064_9PROT|nr:alpha/beta hydrolase [Lichenicoccus roseus]TLU70922.1 alpha/beta hydrolase [Lichenicoccus roseus]
MIRLLKWLLGGSALATGGLAAFSWWTARKVEAALPPKGRFLDVAGSQLHYVDTGKGPPILLIHGLGGQLLNFAGAGLQSLGDDHRVIALDRPGSGYSRRPFLASAALGAQAATVAGFIRALGLGRPLIVGHSLGGALALTLALNHPDCVGGLALLAPLTSVQDRVPVPFRRLVLRSRLLRMLVAWTVATPMAIRNRDEVMHTVFGPDAVPGEFPTVNGGMLALRPAAFFSASTDLTAVNQDMPGLVARFGSIKVPVGILFGTADRVLDYDANGTALKEVLPALDLELVEGAGHMIPVTAPERTLAFIRRMAEQVTSAG